jgi:hypothetical protein
MAWIIGLVLIAIVAVAVIGFAVHLLFSPWLLAIAAVAAWLMFRSRRSRQ